MMWESRFAMATSDVRVPLDLSEKHDGFEWVASRRRSLRHWVNGLARLLRPGP